MRLLLNFPHLLLDLFNAFSNNFWIKVVFHEIWVEAAVHHWVWPDLPARERILLQLNDLLKLIDFVSHI